MGDTVADTAQNSSPKEEEEFGQDTTAQDYSAVVKSINLVSPPHGQITQEQSGRPKSAQSDHEIDASKDCENLFPNLNNAKRFAIDIGGSLTKIAYYSTVSHRRIKSASRGSPGVPATNSNNNDFEYEIWEGARLHFIKFETTFIEECLDFIQKNLAPNIGASGKESGQASGKFIKATGIESILVPASFINISVSYVWI